MKTHERLKYCSGAGVILGGGTGQRAMLRDRAPCLGVTHLVNRSLGWHHNLAADLVAVCHLSKPTSGFGEVSRIFGGNLGTVWSLSVW